MSERAWVDGFSEGFACGVALLAGDDVRNEIHYPMRDEWLRRARELEQTSLKQGNEQ